MTESRTEQMHAVTRSINSGDIEGALRLAEQLDKKEERPGDHEWIHSRIALAKGQIAEAEKIAVEGLKKHPANYSLYFTLGNILAELGEPAAAKSCLTSSSLGDYINNRYFPSEVEELRAQSNDFEPKIIYHEENKDFTDDAGLSIPLREEFSSPYIDGTLAGVCVIDDGKVWFDGHNLCVYDANDELIEVCSGGNPCLVDSIRRKFGLTRLKGSLGVAVAPGTHNYFHWTTDLIPGFHLIDSIGAEHGAVDQYLVSHQDKPFQLEFLNLVGIQPDNLFTADIQTGCYFAADKIVVPVFEHTTGMSLTQWAVDYLRELASPVMGTSLQNVTAKFGKRIYISRRDVSGRSVGNEEALLTELKTRGFEDVALDGMSVAEQISLFHDCEMVVAPHGAGLTNILYCPPGATVLEYFGDFVNPCFRAVAHIGKLNYLQLSLESPDTELSGTVEQTRKKHAGKFQGFDLSATDIESILALVDENAPVAAQLPVPQRLAKAIENKFKRISGWR